MYRYGLGLGLWQINNLKTNQQSRQHVKHSHAQFIKIANCNFNKQWTSFASFNAEYFLQQQFSIKLLILLIWENLLRWNCRHTKHSGAIHTPHITDTPHSHHGNSHCPSELVLTLSFDAEGWSFKHFGLADQHFWQHNDETVSKLHRSFVHKLYDSRAK